MRSLNNGCYREESPGYSHGSRTREPDGEMNEQVKKVFWALFVAMAGLVLARVMDPVTAQQVVGLITGMGG